MKRNIHKKYMKRKKKKKEDAVNYANERIRLDTMVANGADPWMAYDGFCHRKVPLRVQREKKWKEERQKLEASLVTKPQITQQESKKKNNNKKVGTTKDNKKNEELMVKLAQMAAMQKKKKFITSKSKSHKVINNKKNGKRKDKNLKHR